jgi:hypothetical protein
MNTVHLGRVLVEFAALWLLGGLAWSVTGLYWVMYQFSGFHRWRELAVIIGLWVVVGALLVHLIL